MSARLTGVPSNPDFGLVGWISARVATSRGPQQAPFLRLLGWEEAAPLLLRGSVKSLNEPFR